jgi:hypothetical protein
MDTAMVTDSPGIAPTYIPANVPAAVSIKRYGSSHAINKYERVDSVTTLPSASGQNYPEKVLKYQINKTQSQD